MSGAKYKLEMIKAELQESRFSNALPVYVTAKCGQWDILHWSGTSTSFPILFWVFIESLQMCPLMQNLNIIPWAPTMFQSHIIEMQMNKTGAFSAKAHEQVHKLMAYPKITVECRHMKCINQLWWEYIKWLRGTCKDSCHVLGLIGNVGVPRLQRRAL